MENSGIKLHLDDIADDLQTYYTDHLNRGLTGPEITKQLLEENPELPAEALSTFWIRLADTQWNLGILEDTVQENALRSLENHREK